MSSDTLILNKNQLIEIFGGGVLDSDRKNLYVKCPYCGHNEAGVSLSKVNNPFNCFRKKKCGEQKKIQEVLDFLGLKEKYIDKKSKNVVSHKVIASINKNKEGSIEEDTIIALPNAKMPIGWKRIYDHPYLKQRDFQDYESFPVGITKLNKKYEGYLVFKVIQNGELKGFIGRWPGNHKKKYNNSTHDFAKMLFGIDRVNIGDSIILQEGIFDFFNTYKWERDSEKVTSTFGAKFSNEQALLLKSKSVKEITFMFESDVDSKTKSCLVSAHYLFDNIYACVMPDGVDPGDIKTKDEYYSILNNRVPFFNYINRVVKKIKQ